MVAPVRQVKLARLDVSQDLRADGTRIVANLQPPSLAAIIPWEGFADLYRDALFHGGLLSVFMTNWFTAHLMHHTVGRASQNLPNGWPVNPLHFRPGNNLDSGAFRRAQAQWDKITVPMLWSANGNGSLSMSTRMMG